MTPSRLMFWVNVKLAAVWLAFIGWCVLSMCLYGCATTSKPGVVFPHQDDAAQLIWRIYGRTDKPPQINWVHVEPGEGCAQRKSGDVGFRTVYGECVGGVTYDPFVIYSIEPVDRTYSETSVAHEFQHAARMRDGRIDCWIHDTEFMHMVDVANAALDKAGL